MGDDAKGVQNHWLQPHWGRRPLDVFRQFRGDVPYNFLEFLTMQKGPKTIGYSHIREGARFTFSEIPRRHFLQCLRLPDTAKRTKNHWLQPHSGRCPLHVFRKLRGDASYNFLESLIMPKGPKTIGYSRIRPCARSTFFGNPAATFLIISQNA